MYSGKLIMMVLNYKSRHLLSSLLLVCRGSSAVQWCAVLRPAVFTRTYVEATHGQLAVLEAADINTMVT